MSEILMAKGKLADLLKQQEEAEERANAYLIMLRELLTPLSDFLDLDLNKAFLLIKDFRELQIKARNIDSSIKKIKEEWGL